MPRHTPAEQSKNRKRAARGFQKGGAVRPAVKKKVSQRSPRAKIASGKRFQRGGKVEPLNDAQVRAFERHLAKVAPKAKKPKGRAGRKTLGEASAAARRRGTSTSKRLDKPLDFKKGGGMRKNESEGEFLIRTGQRPAKPKNTRRAPR